MRAPWINSLQNPIDLGSSIALSAMNDLGIHESPMGSNRGLEIDEYNTIAESPLGSNWCGNFVGYHYKLCNALTPKFTGTVATWLDWSTINKTLVKDPLLGSTVLYGNNLTGHPEHMGIVICLDPLLSMEGNTSIEGYNRDGEIVTLKYIPFHKLILGYVRPTPSK